MRFATSFVFALATCCILLFSEAASKPQPKYGTERSKTGSKLHNIRKRQEADAEDTDYKDSNQNISVDFGENAITTPNSVITFDSTLGIITTTDTQPGTTGISGVETTIQIQESNPSEQTTMTAIISSNNTTPVLTYKTTKTAGGGKFSGFEEPETFEQDNPIVRKKNLFGMVTIPSLIVLLCLFFIILCCTANLNGCLCRICGGEIVDTSYTNFE